MRLRLRLAAGAAVVLTALWTLVGRADWKQDGSLLSTYPEVVVGADGRGGIFGSNNPAQSFPRLYHLDVSGDTTAGWPVAGIELTPGMTADQHASIRAIAILPDGEGGMFVLTREKAPYQGHGGFWYPDQFYLHRRTADGSVAPGWTTEGACLATPYLDPRYTGLHLPRMVPDGTGGVLVAWLGWAHAWLGSPDWPNPRVVVQRVTAAGLLVWGDDGITVREGPGACTIPALVGDGRGGALVFWGQWDASGTSIRVCGQHVMSSGRLLWDPEGKVVSTRSYDRMADAVPADGGWVWANYHTAIAATTDGESGAILVWAGARGADLNIVATRVAPDGRLPWRHDVSVCSAPGEQATVACTGWGEGGAIVAWRDGRRGADVGIYAQAIRHDGRARWTADGIAVGLGAGERGPVLVASDGREGTYFVWGDPTAGGRVLAQRLLHSGRPAPGWSDNGSLVSRIAEPDYSGSIGLSLVEGRKGTAIGAWTSWRKGSFAMLLTPHGLAAPAKTAVRKPKAAPLGNGPVPDARPAFAIRRIHPNPATAGGIVRLALSESAPASLEMFDIAGRRVWSREVGTLGPGEHNLILADGARLPAGVYLVRLTQGKHVATARAVFLH
ncbi:MAG: T9SS type A sorting domain-containing protein [Planctomycetota bacterium]